MYLFKLVNRTEYNFAYPFINNKISIKWSFAVLNVKKG